MTREEIKKLIETEKQHLEMFLKMTTVVNLSDEEIEKQVDFYLDSINKLKSQLKNAPK